MRYAILERGPDCDRLWPQPFYEKADATTLRDALADNLTHSHGQFSPSPTFHVIEIGSERDVT